MKKCRVKYQGRWYDAEEFQHPGMKESGFLVAGHVFNKSDFEAYYLVSDKNSIKED
jgi:hypothetical protein